MKLGRRPRTFDPSIPHLSALRMMRRDVAPAPLSVDYRKGVTDWKMMLNDTLGDCTIAGLYHSIQVWTLNSQATMLTEPDDDVLRSYEGICGYNPADPSTDQGGVEQDVLRTWLQSPVWRGKQAQAEERLVGYVEIDPRNHEDIRQAILGCGVVYIGFNVPSALMNNLTPLWNVAPGGDIEGGHCVVLPGYGPTGPYLISWGHNYQMTWEMWDAYVDEAYALIDKAWVAATGKTPLGIDLATLKAQMSALKAAA